MMISQLMWVLMPPLSAHTAGKVRIFQFRGEEGGNTVHTTELSAGEAGYVMQGAIHTVENAWKGTTRFLQIFDHPQGGAVFASQALTALPRRLVNAAFSENVIDQDTTANGAIVPIRDCQY
jgi:oxalate decarboxylase/phosphoglucose isomerase-like protein (cupin superfamily)